MTEMKESEDLMEQREGGAKTWQENLSTDKELAAAANSFVTRGSIVSK